MSSSGTATIASGTNSTETRLAEARLGAVTTRPANAAPRNRLPASPMKMDAGWKLYRKNPIVAPVSDHATEACTHAPSRANASPRKKDAIAPTPAATPSSPSSRLNALVSATNQNNVTTTLPAYHGVTGRTAPRLSSVTPASSWSRNLSCGRMCPRSSVSPTTSMKIALAARPSAGPAAARSGRTAQPSPTSSVAVARPAAVATAMAMPPSSGVGGFGQRSDDGCVTAPTRSASARAARVSARAASRDVPTIATAATTVLRVPAESTTRPPPR